MNVADNVPKGKQRGNVLFPYKFIQSIKPFVFLNNSIGIIQNQYFSELKLNT